MCYRDPHLALKRSCLVLAWTLGLCSFTLAGEGPDHGAAGKTIKFPDVRLLDQDGRSVDFYRDLVQGKVVVVNFIFTTCPTICPPMGANFGKLQKLLGDHATRGINLISISINPGTDSTERLKAWATQFEAGPGWTLLTGEKRDVESLLKAMNTFSADFSSHSPTVLIGNDAQNRWTRANGLAAPEQLLKIVESMVPAPDAAEPHKAK